MGWYGGCGCEDVMVSQFDTSTTRGRLTFISTDFAGASYYFARVRSSFDRLECGKFYIISNETGGSVTIPGFNIISTDGGESLTECCDVTLPTPPTIISPWHIDTDIVDIKVSENTTLVTNIVASGDSPIVYSIANFGDGAKFNLNATSGELSFVSSPDFETPSDSDGNNIYTVKVTATNDAGSDELTLNVEVLDVADTTPVSSCPISGNVEDSCLEVILKDGYDAEGYQNAAGIYEYNPNDSAFTSTDLSVDNSKPHWIKADGSGVEIFFVYVEDHPSDDYTDFGCWWMAGPNSVSGPALPWGYGPSAGPPWNTSIPPYPWCKGPDQGHGPKSLWGFADVEQVECVDPVVIPCCDGFTYTHDKSTEDDPTQTGEQYGDVELQKSKNPFPTIEAQYPQWNIATLCHNGATGGVPSRSPIDITTHQDYLGLTSYPYKHGEIALGAEYVGEMRVTLNNGDCYHACISPEVEEIIFVPESEPLACG